MPPVVRTAPVLAVVVCHDSGDWLRLALSALRRSAPRPRHVVAVDAGSTDDTARVLAAADVVDGIVTLPRDIPFAEAAHRAVDYATERWGDPGGWIWFLHDDSAPEPGALAALLTAADVSPRAAVFGPVAVDWSDPGLVVEAGLSTDASGHRQTGSSDVDWSGARSTEVLAVPSAGLLVRRAVWDGLGGFDRDVALREDIDFGWRANRAGHVVLCVPAARLRHVRALGRGLRDHAAGSTRALDRVNGLRVFLTNCSAFSFVVGVPRLLVLCLLRALGFAVQRRLVAARAELVAAGSVLRVGSLVRARRTRTGSGGVRGLFTSRLTRLRNAGSRAVSAMVRRRVAADAALGRLPDDHDPAWSLPEDTAPARGPLGPDSLPAGAARRPRHAGLRRPPGRVTVPLDEGSVPAGMRPSPAPRPSPRPRDGSDPEPRPDLVLVSVDRGRVLRQILLSPVLLLVVGLVVAALVSARGHLGLDLSGGRLLPVGDLGRVWSDYVAPWHGVGGGTAAPAPAALAVLGALGAVFAPIGGPQAVVGLLFVADLPLAGAAAYLATRRAPVRRWVRALLAAGYALLPPAAAAVAQGRLDVVVVHVLLPLVASGIAALIVRGRRAWLSTAAVTAFGLAVIGAFSPLVHLLLVVAALAGFVLVPGDGGRRGAALFLLVLLPLGLLLPWPAVVIQHPAIVLHGLGATVTEHAARLTDLLTLHPGGPGAWPWVGAVVVVAVVLGLLVRPHRAALPGIGVAVLGVLGVVFVQVVDLAPVTGGPAQPGWAGAPLLVVGWGLVWALLGVSRTGAGPVRLLPAAAVFGAVAVAALACGVLAAPRGPLRSDAVDLPDTLRRELEVTHRSVLLLGTPTRQSLAGTPRFGDDDLPPVNPNRLTDLARDLAAADPGTVRTAIARAAATGALFIVAEDPTRGDRLRALGGDLLADAPNWEGRPVFRIQLAAGPATLLSPDQARQALGTGTPPAALGVTGVVPVDATPPALAVRVSDGPEGRLLVVAAEDEPGWVATIDGRPTATVRAWGHLLAVPVPTRAAEVRVEQPDSLRGVLLLVQGAIVLFALLTAIPGRRRPADGVAPSTP